MKLVNMPKYISKEVIDYINGNVREMTSSDFDNNSFLNWLVEKNIASKTNPTAYIKACFVSELNKGTFKPKPKVEYIPNTQVLINEMRDKGIVILADESAYINVLFNYLLNMVGIDGATLRQLNRKVLDYMSKGQSFSEYLDLLKQSNTLKGYEINWGFVERRTQEYIDEWNNTLDEIETKESEE